MPITIGSNISSLRAQRELAKGTDALSKTYERLSSGQRINRASDDAAGLSVASTLNANSRVYTQAIRNIEDGLSMLSIADGAVDALVGIVTRIQELAEQSANGVYSSSQRTALNTEAQALSAEYTRITQTTSFNGTSLFGSGGATTRLQVGTDSNANSRIEFSLNAAFQLVGDGTFQAGVSIVGGLGTTTRLRTADFNEDGKADALVQGNNSSSLYMFLGNGNGTFGSANDIRAGGGQGTAIAAADFNGDGHSDIAYGNGSSAYLILGNGNGTFKAHAAIDMVTDSYREFQVGDFNADGIADLIGAAGADSTTNVLLGNGNGTFKAKATYSTTSALEIALADVNNDGKTDFITLDANAVAWVGIGSGVGTFATPVSYSSITGNGRAVAVGDVNGDNFVDIIGASSGSGPGAALLLGNGNGTFGGASTIESNNPFGIDVKIADINADGKGDLLRTANGALYTYIGNGNGTFKASVSYSTLGGSGGDIAYTDISGDGVADVLTIQAGGTLLAFTSNATSSAQLPSIDLSSRTGALSSLDNMQNILSNLLQLRGTIGANQSRLSVAMRNNESAKLGSERAASAIVDADMAQESAELVRRQILQQASVAVLAQANQQPEIAINLLRQV